MKLYLSNQKNNFPEHLKSLKKQDINVYDLSQLTEKKSVIDIDTCKTLKELNLSFFFDYKIFPDNIMEYLTEWGYEKREMRVGDTIVQQAFIPPFRQFSQKIIFGVRVNKIINEPTKLGFSYETIKGHPEKGISIFTIENTSDGKIIFKIHTFSVPGNFLAKLVGALFSIPYQKFCTKQGLKNIKHQLENHLN